MGKRLPIEGVLDCPPHVEVGEERTPRVERESEDVARGVGRESIARSGRACGCSLRRERRIVLEDVVQ